MAVQRISSGGVYEPKIGYCRAVVADGLIHVAGTVGSDPESGEIPEDVVEQCQNALTIIERALTSAGAGFADVLRVRYILPDRRDFEPCWPLLAETFGDNPPAATMIEAGLIADSMKIEIEVTARVPD